MKKTNKNNLKNSKPQSPSESESESETESTEQVQNDGRSIRTVKSFCRIRSFEGNKNSLFKYSKKSNDNSLKQTLTVNIPSTKSKLVDEFGNKFSFDYIFDEEYTQKQIFKETCLDLLSNLVDKLESSMLLCQGLRNSGKTYSLLGNNKNSGLLPLSLGVIFDKMKEKKADNIKLYCSYFEFYKGGLYDLLSSEENNSFVIPLRGRISNKNNKFFF
jgi:hypothetical protein